MPERDRAQDINTRAMEHEERGEIDEAEALYKLACQADEDFPFPMFNLGLLCKRQRRWSEALAYNQRAVQLDPDDQAGWWNLGIAATALEDWAEARRAWTGAGVAIPEGEGPLTMDMGTIPVRLDPAGNGEVVWGSRIDPARAILLNVPLPESRHRFRDLLLHDGAPSGYRTFGEVEVPVFDTLQCLEQSPWSTFAVDLDMPDPDALQALVEVVTEAGDGIEDWGTVRTSCTQCSEGRPPEGHEHHGAAPDQGTCVAIATRTEQQAQEHLEAWMAVHPGVRLLGFECLVDADSPSVKGATTT
jgi:hypothetical protein